MRWGLWLVTQRHSLSCWNANKKIVPGQIKKIVVMMFNFVLRNKNVRYKCWVVIKYPTPHNGNVSNQVFVDDRCSNDGISLESLVCSFWRGLWISERPFCCLLTNKPSVSGQIFDLISYCSTHWRPIQFNLNRIKLQQRSQKVLRPSHRSGEYSNI